MLNRIHLLSFGQIFEVQFDEIFIFLKFRKAAATSVRKIDSICERTFFVYQNLKFSLGISILFFPIKTSLDNTNLTPAENKAAVFLTDFYIKWNSFVRLSNSRSGFISSSLNFFFSPSSSLRLRTLRVAYRYLIEIYRKAKPKKSRVLWCELREANEIFFTRTGQFRIRPSSVSVHERGSPIERTNEFVSTLSNSRNWIPIAS